MATPATPIYTVNSYKAEVAYGTVPSASGAQVARRVTATFDLEKDTYTSNEQRTDFQRADMRHGVRKVTGKVSGELSNGSYSDFLSAALKRTWSAIADQSGLTLTITGGPTYTITRAAGDWLAGGLKNGTIVYLTGGTANNINKRLLVTNVQSTTVFQAVVLNGASLTTETAVVGYTLRTPGKINYIPLTGHLTTSFAWEKWFPDLVQSEVYSGLRPTKTSIKLPPTGLATIDIELMGQNITTAASQYFTSPTAALSSGIMASVNGAARVSQQVVGNITAFSVDIVTPWSADPVIGTNILPETVPDTVVVSGSMTINFDNVTLRDNFLNENTLEIMVTVTADNTDTAAAISIVMSKVKLTSFNKTDEGGKSVSCTVNYEALYNSAGGAATKTEATTIWILDTNL